MKRLFISILFCAFLLLFFGIGYVRFSYAQEGITYGKVVRYSDDEPHGIVVTIPASAPSIAADFKSLRGADGKYRGRGGSTVNPVNLGITIKLNERAEIISAAPGKVFSAGYSRWGGHWLVVVTPTVNYLTLYAHLTETFVKRGDEVKRGQPLGKVGEAEHTNTPHLSLQIKESGTPRGKGQVNPHLHWIGGDGKINCFKPDAEYKIKNQHFMTYPVKCK